MMRVDLEDSASATERADSSSTVLREWRNVQIFRYEVSMAKIDRSAPLTPGETVDDELGRLIGQFARAQLAGAIPG